MRTGAADVELVRALERCELPNAGFHHVDHLRVGLVYLEESSSVAEAIDRMASTLRRFAASVGKAEKYSQATTEFWMYQLAAARALKPDATADTLLACSCLLDKNLILAYGSSHDASSRSADSSRDA